MIGTANHGETRCFVTLTIGLCGVWHGISETQLSIERIQIANFRQRGQLIKVLQIKIIKELSGGCIHRGSPGNIPMTNDPNPFPFMQRLNNIGAHRHATNFLDLATGDGLTVGYQGKCFQHGAGVLGRALLPQPRNPRTQRLAYLKAEPASDLYQLKSTVIAALCDFFQGLSNERIFRPLLLFKQLRQLRYRHGLSRRQQRAFNDLYQSCFRHLIPTLP